MALSIEDVSTKARVSPHTWVRAEHGEEIRPSSARRVAAALGVEPERLMGGTSGPLGEAPSPPETTDEERRESVEADAYPVTSAGEEGDLLLLRSAVGAGHISLEDFSEAQLASMLARFNKVRRRLEESDFSEENKQKAGKLVNGLINAVALELNKKRGAYREKPGSPPHPRYREITHSHSDEAPGVEAG